MKTLIISGVIKLLNIMPFYPSEVSQIYNCIFSDIKETTTVDIELIDNCISRLYPEKYDILITYNGLDSKECAFYPYRPTIRYYGLRSYDGQINPCYITPEFYKNAVRKSE